VVATSVVLRAAARAVFSSPFAELFAQLSDISHRGVMEGDFMTGDGDSVATARAVFHATNRFHDPAYAHEWEKPGIEAEFSTVVTLVLRGLRRRID
ncbi:TetR/AcrR family transcriptional regulator, partial [Streptomyces sp. NPDC127044]